MDLEELRAFLAVLETGSFLAAERTLGLPRSTIRRRLDALEARAGVPLVRKMPAGLVATEAGRVLATRGQLMLQEARALVASLREFHREPTGVLRVQLPLGMPPQLLVPLFAAFRSNHPRLSFELRFGHDPVGALLHDADVAVHLGLRPLPGPWVHFDILPVRERLLAHADYIAARGLPTSLDDLRAHDLLVWTPPDDAAHELPLLSGGTFPVTPVLSSPDVHFVRQCALRGQGIAWVPDALLPDPGIDPEAIVPVLEDTLGRTRVAQVVVPVALAEVPKIKAILTHLRAVLPETP